MASTTHWGDMVGSVAASQPQHPGLNPDPVAVRAVFMHVLSLFVWVFSGFSSFLPWPNLAVLIRPQG